METLLTEFNIVRESELGKVHHSADIHWPSVVY